MLKFIQDIGFLFASMFVVGMVVLFFASLMLIPFYCPWPVTIVIYGLVFCIVFNRD